FLPADSGTVTIAAPQLFAGDTLFAGSIGRTDLWGGSMQKMMDSPVHKLLALPDETVVYPGHGLTTTIGEERQSNPFLVKKYLFRRVVPGLPNYFHHGLHQLFGVNKFLRDHSDLH